MKAETEKDLLRVCYFGTYRANYVRNQVLLQGLRSQGAEVVECHSQLWHGVEDRVNQASGGWRTPSFWKRVLQAYWRLWQNYRRVGHYDVMLIGYPGQFDTFLGRALTWLRGRPLALDVLMSLHLIAEERGLTRRSPFTGRLIYWLERLGLKLPNLLIADTLEYRDYYCQKYGLDPARFQLVPLGVDDSIFQPKPHLKPPEECFRVIYYGTFIPLHGVETVLRAAAALKEHPNIRFDFYGEGQELSRMRTLADELQLDNVLFHGWLDSALLPAEIAKSHICLGVFGTTKQSLCTIQNKIWEGMMMQRPVITGDAPTVRATLEHKKQVYLVERANPRALAQGILELAGDPDLRALMAREGYERAQANTIAATGSRIKQALLSLKAGT